jgi:hypothetical protein
VDETGAITSAPDPAAERARKRKEARERAKAAAQANPKAKAKAKPRAKPKARMVINNATKRAPRKKTPVQIVNAPPSAYVEPDEEDIGAHHATADSSTDPLPLAAKRARQKQDKGKGAKKSKKGGSVQNTIEEIIESSKLPPAEQALLPKRKLNTKVARPKKGRKKKGGGLEPILEHNDVQDDPYYMKPPLPTHMK